MGQMIRQICIVRESLHKVSIVQKVFYNFDKGQREYALETVFSAVECRLDPPSPRLMMNKTHVRYWAIWVCGVIKERRPAAYIRCLYFSALAVKTYLQKCLTRWKEETFWSPEALGTIQWSYCLTVKKSSSLTTEIEVLGPSSVRSSPKREPMSRSIMSPIQQQLKSWPTLWERTIPARHLPSKA